MITHLLIIISQLFLFNFSEKKAIEPSSLSNKIEKKVVKIAKKKNIPSLEATITIGNESINFDYNHEEVEKQTIYGVASVTKLLTSVMIFKLIEDKKLKLTDKVTDYVNLSRPISGIENLTIKNLLNHTSGLSDYTQHPNWLPSVINNNAPKTFEEKMLLVKDTLKNTGSFSYCNTNYLLFHKIIDTLMGEPYHIAFNNFYSNHHLSNIKMEIDEIGLQAFFGQTDKKSSNVSTFREYNGLPGGAFTDAKTLDSFLTKLFRDKSILKANTLLEMQEWIETEPFTIPIGNGKISKYRYGIMKLTYDKQEYIGHFGSSLKYQSIAFYNLKKDISISLVSNCSGRNFNNVFFQELVPAILDEL